MQSSPSSSILSSMPGNDLPTLFAIYSLGGVIVIPPVASVIPYPLINSILFCWKNRKMSGSKYPAADRPHFKFPPVIFFNFLFISSSDDRSKSMESLIESYICTHLFGILIKTVGDMIEKSFNKELNAGDSAKVYVAPQKIEPINSKYLPNVWKRGR